MRQYHFESKYFPHQSRHRELYGQVVNLCVNQELRTDFGLEVFTEIEYCHEPGRRLESLSTWDGLCIAVICLLAGLAVLSTIFDCHLKKKSTLGDHFGTDPESIGKLLTITYVKTSFKFFSSRVLHRYVMVRSAKHSIPNQPSKVRFEQGLPVPGGNPIHHDGHHHSIAHHRNVDARSHRTSGTV